MGRRQKLRVGRRSSIPPENPGHRWQQRIDMLEAMKSTNKYHAQRTTVDGYLFDSKREAARYMDLRTMERAGIIKHLEIHPSWHFKIGAKWLVHCPTPSGRPGRRISYTADFRYLLVAEKRVVVEDVKGRDTTDSKLRRALMLFFHGITVEIIR